MISPDTYTSADFERGDRLLNACTEVLLAHELGMQVPAYSDLTDPFEAFLESSSVTLETVGQLQVDDETAQNLVQHVLRNILQKRAAVTSATTARQASEVYGLVSKEFLFREFAAFPASDVEMITATMAVVHPDNPLPVDEPTELPAITGFMAAQNNHRTLRFNTPDQPHDQLSRYKHVLNLFKPNTLLEPAVRLAITETIHDIPYPHAPTAQREHQIGPLNFKI